MTGTKKMCKFRRKMGSVVEFVNVLGTWVEESLLKRLHKAPFF